MLRPHTLTLGKRLNESKQTKISRSVGTIYPSQYKEIKDLKDLVTKETISKISIFFSGRTQNA